MSVAPGFAGTVPPNSNQPATKAVFAAPGELARAGQICVRFVSEIFDLTCRVRAQLFLHTLDLQAAVLTCPTPSTASLSSSAAKSVTISTIAIARSENCIGTK